MSSVSPGLSAPGTGRPHQPTHGRRRSRVRPAPVWSTASAPSRTTVRGPRCTGRTLYEGSDRSRRGLTRHRLVTRVRTVPTRHSGLRGRRVDPARKGGTSREGRCLGGRRDGHEGVGETHGPGRTTPETVGKDPVGGSSTPRKRPARGDRFGGGRD